MLYTITEGWTGLLGPFTLKVDGVPVDLTAWTVTLVLRNAAGALVTPGGTVTKLDQVQFPGQVTYAPIATDFVCAPNVHLADQTYTLRWKVVDAQNKVVYFPNGEPAEVGVHRT